MRLQVRRRRGTVVVLLALFLIPIMAIAAIALDGGVIMAQRRHAQSTADASALAAASSIYQNYSKDNGLDPDGTAAAAARAIAAGNGFTNDGTNSTVTVTVPPGSGTFSGTSGYVEVSVRSSQARQFSGIWGSGSMTVTGRAVARGTSKAYSKAGIILLDPSSQQSLNLSGSATLNTNATVIVDSSHTKAVVGSSTASVTAPNIDITGGYSLSGSSKLNGTVRTGVSPTADPLASLAAPSAASMPTVSSSTYSVSGGSATLSPGVYKGGISISGGASVTLQPGIYYMQGGGFKMSSSSSLSGTGVMIYNDPVSSGDVVTVTGSGTLNLSPPITGPYAGITLWQRRDATSAPAITGGSNASISGTFYFASARLNVSGSSGLASLGSQYISYDLTISGSGTVSLDWGNNKVARRRSLTLVE